MALCPSFDPLGPYVSNVLAYVDCHAGAFAEMGYAALGPGSAYGLAFTGMLTIFVALIGYRLLVGSPLTMRDGAGVVLRLGVVLALATQWPAYRALVFDIATQAPEELSAGILEPSGLGGNSRTLAARIDGVGAALADMVNTPSPAPTPTATPEPGQPAPINNAGRVLPPEAAKAVNSAAGFSMMSALAGFLSVRVIVSLLLAMGPVFVGFLLFDATRGLFVGWGRVLIGGTLGAMAVPVAVALELAVLEPQVLMLRAMFDGNEPLGILPQAILATATFFGLVIVAALLGAAWVANGLHWPAALGRERFETLRQQMFQQPSALAMGRNDTVINTERGRAQMIADAAVAMQRRDMQLAPAGTDRVVQMSAGQNLAPTSASRDPELANAPVPLGQQWRSTSTRTHMRQSLSANRRDQR